MSQCSVLWPCAGLAGPQLGESRVRHVEVPGSCADREVGLETPVEVGTSGRDEVVPLAVSASRGAFLGRIAAVVALRPAEPGRGQFLEDAVKPGRAEAERQRWASTATAPEPFAVAMKVAASMRAFGT